MHTALRRKLVLRYALLVSVGADILRKNIAQIWLCHARLLPNLMTMVRQTASSAGFAGRVLLLPAFSLLCSKGRPRPIRSFTASSEHAQLWTQGRARVDGLRCCLHPAGMRTLTVDLPDELASRLEAASRSRSVPPAEVVRELVATLPPAAASERSAFEVLGSTFGRSASGLGDLSTNPKHLEGFGE